MRDFNSGNIGGNVVINDNSQEYKPLAQCSNEELLHEEIHRKKILKEEVRRKDVLFYQFIGFSVILIVIAYLLHQLNGNYQLASMAIGALGVVIGLGTLRQSEKRTDFEVRQIQALEEINMILRERGAR